jgi:hypothetical protein
MPSSPLSKYESTVRVRKGVGNRAPAFQTLTTPAWVPKKSLPSGAKESVVGAPNPLATVTSENPVGRVIAALVVTRAIH